METIEPNVVTPTRIAIYDDLLSAPRIVDIQPGEISQYIEDISSKTYEFAQQQGSSIPYTVIREVCENFIHAQFKNPCISILDEGNTIKFTDQGPGIEDKEQAQKPAFTSATTEMRRYIRGVGSGLPTVKEYMEIKNGRLIIEDNIKEGTVVTIQMNAEKKNSPVVYSETLPRRKKSKATLTPREYTILELAREMGLIGPTEIEQRLDISPSTGHRDLEKLEKLGLLTKAEGSRKRMLTDLGLSLLDE